MARRLVNVWGVSVTDLLVDFGIDGNTILSVEDGDSSPVRITSDIELFVLCGARALSSVAPPSVSSPVLAESSHSDLVSDGDPWLLPEAGNKVSFRSFGRQALFRRGAMASSGSSTVNARLKGHGVTSYRRMVGNVPLSSPTKSLSSSVS